MQTVFRMLLLIYLVGTFPFGCVDFSWEAPDPGSVMAKRDGPHHNLYARVVATEVQGTYTFEVRRIKGDEILAKRSISAPVGYHPHKVTLSWDQNGRTASALIDYDFGDNNEVFALSVATITP